MTIPLPALDLASLDPHQSFRAFIGWWPDARTCAYLTEQALQAQAVYGGRMMQPDHFHLTMAFLDRSRVLALQTLAAQMHDWTVPDIKLDLNVRDVFEKPQVVWAGPDESQGQVLALLQQWHEDIWARLMLLGWTQPPRHFRPHVSLLRHARIAPEQSHSHPLPRQAFTGEGLGLIVSVPGEQRSQYHVVATVNPERTAS